VERGERYSRKGEGKFSGSMRWLGLNLRASALGVSSVCMKIVRREVVVCWIRGALNVGLSGAAAECIGLDVRGTATL